MDTGDQSLTAWCAAWNKNLLMDTVPNMQTLTVDLGDRAYPIHIGADLLQQAMR